MTHRGFRLTATLLTTTALTAAVLVTGAGAQAAQPAGTTRAKVPAGSGFGAGEEWAPREFVSLREAAPTVLREIRYTTEHNFTGDPVDGYREPLCLVTRDTAKALRAAQRSLLRRGYSLKVYDCYRPQRAVDDFAGWAADTGDERMKAEFYPRVEKDRLFEDGYIAEKSGHSRGSTVDLTLVRLPPTPTPPYVPGQKLTPCFAPQEERFPDNSVDMGTGFDCFDTLSHTLDPRITGEQRANRLLLKRAMERAGFTNLPEEWWHYTLTDETFPDTYFDFPVARSALRR